MKKSFVQIQLFDSIEMVDQINVVPETKLSKEMHRCVDYLKKEGSLVRYRGGFWAVEGLPADQDDWPQMTPYFGIQTLNALEKRGWLVFADERQSRFGKFFTRVYIAQPKTENHVELSR